MSLSELAKKAVRSKFRQPEPDDDFDLNGGATPVNRVSEQVNKATEPAQRPTEARKSEGATDRRVPAKGSRIAPKRDSTLDAGDGRSRRARGRNSRVSTNVLPEACDALKIGCDDEGVDYCVVLEELIRGRFPSLYAEFEKKYDQMYGRKR